MTILVKPSITYKYAVFMLRLLWWYLIKIVKIKIVKIQLVTV